MHVKYLLADALLGVTPAASQISRTTFGGLPRWADSALIAAGLGRQFTLSSQLNPAYEFGDFDGDGFFDVAVEIKDTGGLRYGIAVVHRIDRSVHLVGAGRSATGRTSSAGARAGASRRRGTGGIWHSGATCSLSANRVLTTAGWHGTGGPMSGWKATESRSSRLRRSG